MFRPSIVHPQNLSGMNSISVLHRKRLNQELLLYSLILILLFHFKLIEPLKRYDITDIKENKYFLAKTKFEINETSVLTLTEIVLLQDKL